MTRTFTVPGEFPTNYTIDRGKAKIVAPMPDGLGYVGYVELEDGGEYGTIWNDAGECVDGGETLDRFDLRDIPATRTLHRDFGIHGRHTITCNQDGTDPTVVWEPNYV